MEKYGLLINLMGLFSYDGQNFKNYTIMDGLPDNQANALYIENNNSIWVTTNNGVAIFNGEILELYMNQTMIRP